MQEQTTTQSVRDVAIVTGGRGSMGRVLCNTLARSGTLVVAADVESSERGPDVEGVVNVDCDVRSQANVDSLFEFASGLGVVNAVVTCHGVIRPTPLDLIPPDDLTLVVDANLGGVIRVCAAAARCLRSGSAIVNISSVVASRGGSPGTVVYAATKAGIESVSRHYAVGLASQGVRVNSIAPGFVEASMAGPGREIRSQLGDDLSSITSQVPLERLVTHQEIADLVLFLLSPAASSITGVLVPIDGGLLARG